MEIILYRISLSLTKHGYKFNQYKWLGSETKNSYMVQMESEIEYGGSKRRVNKSDILKPSSNILQSHSRCGYSLWCFEDQIEEGKEILFEEVNKTAIKIRNEALLMFEQITDNYNNLQN